MERYKFSFASVFMGGVFLMFGTVVIVIGAAFFITQNNFMKTAVPVTAQITDISRYKTKKANGETQTNYRVDIVYEYEGETYNDTLDYYAATMHKGDRLEVYVDPTDPDRQRSNQEFMPFAIMLTGLFFGAIGAAIFASEIKNRKYINGLIADDKYVYADFSGEEPASLVVNKVRYKQAVFVYSDGGKELRFASRPYHPNECPYSRGDVKKVYVDMENNPGKYYVSRLK